MAPPSFGMCCPPVQLRLVSTNIGGLTTITAKRRQNPSLRRATAASSLRRPRRPARTVLVYRPAAVCFAHGGRCACAHHAWPLGGGPVHPPTARSIAAPNIGQDAAVRARGVSEASPAVASERPERRARGVSEASPAVASERPTPNEADWVVVLPIKPLRTAKTRLRG